MTPIAHFTALLLVLGYSWSLQSQADDPQSFVSGHVYTVDGRPLAHANIDVLPLEVGFSGPMPWAVTDQNGSYHLASPSFGKTRICARLEDFGYPDTRLKVFASGNETFPEVQLKPGVSLENVNIHLDQPDGTIEANVVDKETQLPLKFARVTMRWAEDSFVMYSTNVSNGSFHYALPKRKITLTVICGGYKSWTFEDPASHARFLEIAPYEHRQLQIELERIPSQLGAAVR